jgi:hypothetical protein
MPKPNPSGSAVEKVGIEPTTTTLARRVRSLSCHPHGRRPGPPRQGGRLRATATRRRPGASAAHPRRTGGAGRLCGSACRTKRFSTIELIMCMHVRQNNGGASHGRQESNLVFAGFGDQPPIRWLTHLRYYIDPKEKPPARACVLGAASVSAALRLYPDAHRLLRYDPGKDMAISQSRLVSSAHR